MDNKFTKEDLKIMQSWSLEQKIKTTQAKIIEFKNAYPNGIYVSFSGGKDSTVLLDLVRRIYPDTPAVFIDTGLEYPELKDFVKSLDNITIIKPDMNFRDVIKTYGYPIISKRVAGYIATAKRNPNSVRAKYLRGDIPSKTFGFADGKYYHLATFHKENGCVPCYHPENGQPAFAPMPYPVFIPSPCKKQKPPTRDQLNEF